LVRSGVFVINWMQHQANIGCFDELKRRKIVTDEFLVFTITRCGDFCTEEFFRAVK